jgi:environmental stress-induced protein Ves
MPVHAPPASDSPIVLRASERAALPWRNGGGTTFEVARRAAPRHSTAEFLWRVSIASVSSAGPFSSFAGFERLIAVIEGRGMRLSGITQEDVALRPFEVFRFDGAASVTGALPQGPVNDLNLIYDPRHCVARLSMIVDALAERRAACAELLILNLAAAPLECTAGAVTTTLDRCDAVWIASPDAIVACCGVERVAVIEIDWPLAG